MERISFLYGNPVKISDQALPESVSRAAKRLQKVSSIAVKPKKVTKKPVKIKKKR